MLSDLQLSDLFFNHDHPNWLNADGPQEERLAILQDAETFAAAYPELGKDAMWYAEDFLKRVL